jgi:hypothetical protein
MSRKQQIQPYQAIDAGNLSDASITGQETVVFQTDVVEYLVTWSGGQATNGNIKIQASHDNSKATPASSWFDLDFGSTISLDGASGNHQLIISQVSFAKVRPVYTRTNGSASGSLNINLIATTKGA